MADLIALANQFDPEKASCRAVIETPRGHRNKFDYDPSTDLFILGGLLPEGMVFPFDFGFIPETLGGDGDPLDVIVLMDAPAHVGCLLVVRLVGVINAEQTDDGKTEKNDRLVGVAIHSYDHGQVGSINELNKTFLSQLEAFFVNYNRERGRKFRISGTGGPRKAVECVRHGMRTYRKKQSKT
jgi:inorganic pyrophosphatase